MNNYTGGASWRKKKQLNFTCRLRCCREKSYGQLNHVHNFKKEK